MNHLLPYIKKTLESHFPPAELKSLTKIICCDLLEISELDFYVRKDIHLSENKQKELETILHRLINHEPIQYIVGYTPFCGHSFRSINMY
jgi:release factor glutamine methyltransferase